MGLSTRQNAPEVRRVYEAEHSLYDTLVPMDGKHVRAMFDRIVASTPELRDHDIQFRHRYMGCAGAMSAFPSGRIVLTIHRRARTMGTLLHELAHAIHFRRAGYETLKALIVRGSDHNHEWRGILLALCDRWAASYGILLREAFKEQGLTVPEEPVRIRSGR